MIHADLEKWLVHTLFPDRPWGGPPFLSSLRQPPRIDDLGELDLQVPPSIEKQ